MTASRTINPNALALRWSLESTYPTLRVEAERIISEVLVTLGGNVAESARVLEIDRRTLNRWFRRSGALTKARDEARAQL